MSSTQGDYGYVDPDGTYTGGHSGSDTSRARAVRMQSSGRGKMLRDEAWDAVRLSGLTGVTCQELQAMLQIGHGSASGVLSNLHKAGKIACLTEQRRGQVIYVLPHAVNARATRPYGRRKPATPPVGTEGGAASDADIREAYEDGYVDGEKVGYDKGWEKGHEEGKATAVARQLLDEARTSGTQEGRMAVKRRALAVVEEAHRTTKASGPVQVHTKDCYKRHPACALALAIRAIQNA